MPGDHFDKYLQRLQEHYPGNQAHDQSRHYLRYGKRRSPQTAAGRARAMALKTGDQITDHGEYIEVYDSRGKTTKTFTNWDEVEDYVRGHLYRRTQAGQTNIEHKVVGEADSPDRLDAKPSVQHKQKGIEEEWDFEEEPLEAGQEGDDDIDLSEEWQDDAEPIMLPSLPYIPDTGTATGPSPTVTTPSDVREVPPPTQARPPTPDREQILQLLQQAQAARGGMLSRYPPALRRVLDQSRAEVARSGSGVRRSGLARPDREVEGKAQAQAYKLARLYRIPVGDDRFDKPFVGQQKFETWTEALEYLMKLLQERMPKGQRLPEAASDLMPDPMTDATPDTDLSALWEPTPIQPPTIPPDDEEYSDAEILAQSAVEALVEQIGGSIRQSGEAVVIEMPAGYEPRESPEFSSWQQAAEWLGAATMPPSDGEPPPDFYDEADPLVPTAEMPLVTDTVPMIKSSPRISYQEYRVQKDSPLEDELEQYYQEGKYSPEAIEAEQERQEQEEYEKQQQREEEQYQTAQQREQEQYLLQQARSYRERIEAERRAERERRKNRLLALLEENRQRQLRAEDERQQREREASLALARIGITPTAWGGYAIGSQSFDSAEEAYQYALAQAELRRQRQQRRKELEQLYASRLRRAGIGQIIGQPPRLYEAETAPDALSYAEYRYIRKGGPGSGHFGHEGRPGKVGGSLPRDGDGAEDDSQPTRKRNRTPKGEKESSWKDLLPKWYGGIYDQLLRQYILGRPKKPSEYPKFSDLTEAQQRQLEDMIKNQDLLIYAGAESSVLPDAFVDNVLRPAAQKVSEGIDFMTYDERGRRIQNYVNFAAYILGIKARGRYKEQVLERLSEENDLIRRANAAMLDAPQTGWIDKQTGEVIPLDDPRVPKPPAGAEPGTPEHREYVKQLARFEQRHARDPAIRLPKPTKEPPRWLFPQTEEGKFASYIFNPWSLAANVTASLFMAYVLPQFGAELKRYAKGDPRAFNPWLEAYIKRAPKEEAVPA